MDCTTSAKTISKAFKMASQEILSKVTQRQSGRRKCKRRTWIWLPASSQLKSSEQTFKSSRGSKEKKRSDKKLKPIEDQSELHKLRTSCKQTKEKLNPIKNLS